MRKIKFVICFVSICSVIFGQDTIKTYWNDSILKRLNILDSVGNGKEVFYYNSGNVRYEGYTYMLKKVGKWTFYREDGSIFKTEFYKDNLLDSIAIFYGINKKIQEIRSYKNDTLNGFSFDFYDTGHLMIVNYNYKNSSIFSETYLKKSSRINVLKKSSS